MKNLFLFLVLLLFNPIIAQVNIKWEKSFGGSDSETPYSIEQTKENGSIIVGKSWSKDGEVDYNNGNGDFWVINLDQNGEIRWKKNLGGSESEEARSVQICEDGGYVIAGLSSSKDGNLTKNAGSYDYWVVKLSATGNLEWQKSYGGNLSDYARSIETTQDGGFIVAGYSSSRNGAVSQNFGSGDYWVVKLDRNGNLEWDKSFGGNAMDQALSIKETPEGDYIVAGFTQSQESKGDYWIIKLNKSGELLWQKKLGGSDHEEVFGLTLTNDNGCVVAGFSKSSDGNLKDNKGKEDYWVVKLNGTGKLEWQKNFGGRGSDIAIDIEKNPKGGYIVIGSSTSTDGDIQNFEGQQNIGSYWLLALNEQGELRWETTLGGSNYEQARSITTSDDGHFVIAGMSSSSDGDLSEKNKGKSDFWIVKIKELPQISTVCFEDLNKNGTYEKNEPILEDLQISISPEADYQIITKNKEKVLFVYPNNYTFTDTLADEWELTSKKGDLKMTIAENSPLTKKYFGFTKGKKPEPIDTVETPKPKVETIGKKKKSLEDITDIQCGETLELSQLRFKPSTAIFLNDEAANDYLKILVRYLKDNPDHKIDLYGHTDFLSNNKAYLLNLSQERVEKVKSFLVKQGINKKRIKTEAFGGDQPIVTDRASKQRSQNRRVEVSVDCS